MAAPLAGTWRPVRGMLTGALDKVEGGISELTPPGCNNTLRWQLGHVIWAGEMLIARRAGQPTSIPDTYTEWFAINTSPANFTDATPEWAELLTVFASSTEHLTNLLATLDPELELTEPLIVPQMGLEMRTVGDAVPFAAAHEAMHVGQINIYRLALSA